LLRRAMGKKKPEEMAQHRLIFREGAAKNGISEAKADEVFDLMEKFAGYGFNKSHAAAYSLLAYHTAWLKVHYTAEFFCANMTVEMDNTDKLKVLHQDACNMGLEFEPPNINRGQYRFEPVSDSVIRYGLGAIKGTGESAIAAIVAEREANGPYSSLFDFCARVDRGRLNKRTVEALIKAGAFDSLHLDRATLLASIDLAFDYALVQEAHANQGGLFDLMDDGHGSSTQEPELPQVTPWGVKERLSLEKTAIGFYLSGHLFDEVEREVRQFVRRRIDELVDSREPQLLAGIVGDFRVINGQRGRLALFKLDDKSASIDARCEEGLIHQHRNLLKDDEFIVVMAKAMPDSFSGGLQLNITQIWDLPTARCRFGKFLRVAVSGKAPDVRRLLSEYPPQVEQTEHGDLLRGLPVRLLIERRQEKGGVMAQVQLGDQAQFFPSDAALASWMAQADEGRAAVVYE
jgi:DNA polymerase-3 subunit alpha